MMEDIARKKRVKMVSLIDEKKRIKEFCFVFIVLPILNKFVWLDRNDAAETTLLFYMP